MDKITLGSAPTITKQTNLQRRIHRNLGAAEKHLIHVLVFEDVAQIEAAERRVQRWTRAWKAACRG